MRSSKQSVRWELLVLRARRGQREAFEQIVRYWEKPLFYYVRRLVETEEDAWDVLQHTWMEVLKGIRSLKDPRRFAPWLYRIARNTALSQLRKSYRSQVRLDEDNDLSGAQAQQEDFGLEGVEQVHHGLAKISLAHREVLTLSFLEDLSMDQIAEVLGIPLGTVKSRLYHAKRALRAVLDQEPVDHE